MTGEFPHTEDIVRVRERSRLSGPTPAASLVELSRLDGRFADAVGRVVRVIAPGGYGKSTTVARWAASDVRPVRWLDVEPIDNDPLVLAATLELALAELGEERTSSSDPDEMNVTAVRALGHAMERTRPFVLVIDDIHHIDDKDSMALIEVLADRLPEDSTLVLVGRALHSDSVARLRLRPGVIDVAAHDLAFDLGETEQMMLALGLRPDIDDITNLFGHFEGWPAGLRLAALAHDRVGETADNGAFAGVERSQFVTSYVASEWLGRLDPDDRTFLREVACLRRFAADMCDEVLGRVGSVATITRLAHEEAMVLPLDQRDDWFRMHPLLSESLSEELRTRDRSRWNDIHAGAARWWADQGDADLAIEHALTAGDVDLGESLIIAYAPQYMGRGMSATVLRWLDDLGDRMLTSPLLCSYAAVVAVQTGRGERASYLLSLLPGTLLDESEETINRVGVIRMLMAPCRPIEAIELSETIEALPAGGWRATARWARAVNLFFLGDPRAMDTLGAALVESELAELGVAHANILATMSIIDDLENRRSRAEDLARRAQDLVGRQRVETVATTAVVSSATALAAVRLGQHAVAREALATARMHYVGFGQIAPWLNIVGRVALVRACLLLDDAVQARELLAELRRLRAGDDRIAIDDRLDELESEIEGASAVLKLRSQSLTDAELRVLQHLPTNLSLSDIATRSFVSRNTVKSHTAAIYRKLGANSRSEAVELARRAGLIEGG